MSQINCLCPPPHDEKEPETTKWERWSWYSYDWANSAFDSGIPFVQIMIALFAQYAANEDCKVRLIFFDLDPGSVALVVTSIAILLQVILFILISSFADYGSTRKLLLYMMAIPGACFLIMMGFFNDENLWWLISLLFLLSLLFFGASTVFYNSYLPLLTRNEKSVLEKKGKEKYKKYLKKASEISSCAYIWGYTGGMIVLVFCLVFNLTLFDENPAHIIDLKCPTVNASYRFENGTIDDSQVDSRPGVRAAVSMIGGWWLLWTIFGLIPLKVRQGKVKPADKGYLEISLSTFWGTIKKFHHLPQCGLYLLAYFIASDTYATIGSIGVLFIQGFFLEMYLSFS
eukprot:TRINITY_DN665_c0_g2_i1.p1 TRINITY_DN665_c0_g2~~TRINITY_DN665_c0_g2_i1.p1  ORF type:complete len:343 (+),score=61.65 TRINITY_DN665_c0_g2_i1:288-1316(+)